MKKALSFIFLILMALAAGYYSAGLREKAGTAETAYERVLRTNTLRCGYLMWPDILDKDPNTGELSGIMYDYMIELGKLTGLKIEWTEQVTTATLAESLASGRIDATCFNTWPNSTRGRQIAFTTPMFYNKIFPIVRANDNRFDQSTDAFNNPDVTIIQMDGEVGGIIAARLFPRAKSLNVPTSLSEADMLTNIATGKADLLILFRSAGLRYNRNNPETPIKMLDTALATIPCSIGVSIREQQLKDWLSVTVEEMKRTGLTHTILQKHGDSAIDYFEEP